MATFKFIQACSFLACGLFGITLCVGCGPSGPTVVPVTGIVSRGGKPVANLYLTFMPDNGRPSWGTTDAEGKFKLNYDREQDGAVTGKHKVFVQFKPATVAIELQMQNGTYKPPPDLAEILAKYGDMEKTPLTIEITRQSKDGIELKLD